MNSYLLTHLQVARISACDHLLMVRMNNFQYGNQCGNSQTAKEVQIFGLNT